MKLYTSPTSPYSRKIKMMIYEKGIADFVEQIQVAPYEDPEELIRLNPLGKVPSLHLDGDVVLYDSRVIAGFIDRVSPEPVLIPVEGPKRWAVLRLEALADGMMDEALNIFFRRRDEDGEPAAKSIRRSIEKIERTLPVAVSELENLEGENLNLGLLALASALGYLDLRISEIDWRLLTPPLKNWFEAFSTRPSFIKTAPPDFA